ncbi:hypothetical protein [Persephonella sp. KM09-Lau-8]|uniref:hypothetical protein n=1 Tax=Persephonella sp. KM09-Lau-8 TaxID=1158345 RepID=UPI0004952F48|nr:hypothetical protein [Persephonella sp. KM09-Lau-8]
MVLIEDFIKNILRNREFPLFLLLFLTGIILRIITYQYLNSPTFHCFPPNKDEDFYYFLGKFIKENFFLYSNEVFYYSPFYAYLTSMLKPEVLRILNMLVGSSIPIAVYLSAKYFFKKPIPLILSLIILFLDILIIYDIHILKTSLGIFFITWGFVFYLYSLKNKNLIFPIISGIFFAFASLIYINFLPVVVGLLIYLFIKNRKFATLSLIPVIVLISLTATRNYIVSKDFVMVSAIGGIHFYIGNSKYASGGYQSIPGIRTSAFGHYFDGRNTAEKETGEKLKPSQVNRFWIKKTLNDIVSDPKRWLLLEIKKLFLTFHNYDIPNNINKNYLKSKVPFLKLSTTFGIIALLGLSGLIFSIRKKEFLPVHIFFAVYLLTVLLFFVTDRYRLPLFLPLILYIGVLSEVILQKNLKAKILSGLVVIIFSFWVFWPIDYSKNYSQLALEEKYSVKLCKIRKKEKNTQNPKKLSYLYLQEAYLYMNLKGYEQALFLTDKAIKLNPNNIQAKQINRFCHKIIFNLF